MAKGISLHICVNVVDPDHYQGWSGPLNACESDCDLMQSIAQSCGFEAQQLKTAEATRDAVLGAIKQAAQSLQAGDIFLVSYAGHGGQILDIDGDESDSKDETWCLYDGQLLDDELNVTWAEFDAGTRVLIFSDSCHSGSVSKGGGSIPHNVYPEVTRNMPRKQVIEVARKNYEFYDNIQLKLPQPRPEIEATIALFSGCQDDQLSSEGPENGRFTEAVRDTWQAGEFSGDYQAFHRAILSRMAENQTPNFLLSGNVDPGW